MSFRIKLFVFVILFSVIPVIGVGFISSLTSDNNTALLVSFGIAVFILVFCHFISSKLLNILNMLSAAVYEFLHGNLDKRIDHQSCFFLSALCDYFNEVADSIQQNFTTINERKSSSCDFKCCNLLEASQNIIWECDPQGRIVKINPVCEEVLGYKPEEIIGRKLFEFQQEDNLAKSRHNFFRILQGQELSGSETEIVTKSGNTKTLVYKAVRKIDDNGNTVGLQGTSFDVTGKKRAACQIDMIFDKLSCPLAVCEMIYDKDANPCDLLYLKVNNSFNSVLKVENPENKKASELFSTLDQSWLDEYDKVIRSDNPRSFQNFHKRTAKWWQAFAFKVTGNSFCAIFYDITELKEGNEELESKVGQLQEKVDFRNRELQKANKLLVEQMEALQIYENKLRTLASKLTLSEEREKHRLASELHDNIIQPLVFLDIKLGTLLQNQFDPNTIAAVAEMKNVISDLIKMARNFTFDLSYPVLYELGLEAAIEEWLSEEIEFKTDIKTHFSDDNANKPISNDLRSFLFDSVRELLVNTVKHSKAKNLKVDISRQDDIIVITVEDDGLGFDINEDLSQVGKDSGFGLFSIRERLSWFEGEFEISSKPGKGTSVSLKAPLTFCDREEER